MSEKMDGLNVLIQCGVKILSLDGLSRCFSSRCFLSRCFSSRCFSSRCFSSRCFSSRCFLSRCFLSRCLSLTGRRNRFPEARA